MIKWNCHDKCWRYIFTSAVKRLIAINHIRNLSFCLHNMCVCIVHIYYVYLNTHTYSIYFENIYMYLQFILYINLFNIFKHNIFFSNIHIYIYIYICMFVYLYIHNKYTQYTHILRKQKLLFWMRLIVIKHLPAVIFTVNVPERSGNVLSKLCLLKVFWSFIMFWKL